MADAEAMQGAVENMLLMAANKMEQAVDMENDKLDMQIKAIEDMDEDSLEAIRERRLAAMKKKQAELHAFKQKGHGEYTEITDTKEFFAICKRSPRVVAHFYRGTTWRCQVMDKHLQRLAKTRLETKFVKIDAEKNPFLVERLRVVMLPTCILVKDGKTEHAIIGFDEMGGEDDFDTEALEYVLSQHGLIEAEVAMPESPRAMKKMTVSHKAEKSLRQSHVDSDDELDWD